MDKKFSWQQTANFVCRDPAVGAPDPEVIGRMLRGKFLEIIGPIFGHSLGPLAIITQDYFDIVHDGK